MNKYDDGSWLKEQYEKLQKSIRQIARECNCHKGTIHKRLNKFGIPLRNQRPKKFDDESWLRGQYETLHKSQRQLARDCNCDRSTINTRLKRFGIAIRSRKEYTLADLKEEAEKRGGICPSTEYVHNIPATWICESGHVWEALWSNILYHNSWCPVCSSQRYVNEQRFRDCLESLFLSEFKTRRPEWLIGRRGTRLELDGYNEALGIAFEYQGAQHFKLNRVPKDTPEKFKRRQQNDIDKAAITRERGIILLTPSYKLKQNNFIGYIIDELPVEKLEMAYIN